MEYDYACNSWHHWSHLVTHSLWLRCEPSRPDTNTGLLRDMRFLRRWRFKSWSSGLWHQKSTTCNVIQAQRVFIIERYFASYGHFQEDFQDVKVRVKLPLCLTKHSTMTYWGSGDIAPYILNLGARYRWMVSITPWPLYPQGKNPWYALDRRLGGPQKPVLTR
jgi:hypothetical protein